MSTHSGAGVGDQTRGPSAASGGRSPTSAAGGFVKRQSAEYPRAAAIAEAVHVEHDVDERALADVLLVGQHLHGELMDDQHLRRQVALADDRFEDVERVVHVAPAHPADLAARCLALGGTARLRQIGNGGSDAIGDLLHDLTELDL